MGLSYDHHSFTWKAPYRFHQCHLQYHHPPTSQGMTPSGSFIPAYFFVQPINFENSAYSVTAEIFYVFKENVEKATEVARTSFRWHQRRSLDLFGRGYGLGSYALGRATENKRRSLGLSPLRRCFLASWWFRVCFGSYCFGALNELVRGSIRYASGSVSRRKRLRQRSLRSPYPSLYLIRP